MRRIRALGVIVTLGGLSMAVAAFQAPAAAPSQAVLDVTKIEKVKENLYVITGSSPVPRETFSGGNTGVFITDRGVVVVDTKLANWGPTILERIKTVTNKPVVTVINTHTHGDHTGSNEFFGASVESVVHENTKANMARMDAFKGDKAQFLPKRTYKDKLTLGSRQGSDRPLSLRRGPHQRRHVRGLYGAAHHAGRRHVPVERRAVHRPQQRRQRPRVAATR